MAFDLHSHSCAVIVIILLLSVAFVPSASCHSRPASDLEHLSPRLVIGDTDRTTTIVAADTRPATLYAGVAGSHALLRRSDDEPPRRKSESDALRRQQQQQRKTAKKKTESTTTPPSAQAAKRPPRKSGSRAAHKHNTLRAAARAFAAHPRWLGAFRELATRSNAHRAVLAAIKRFRGDAAPDSSNSALQADLQARLDDAQWAATMRYRVSRIMARLVAAGVLPGSGRDAAAAAVNDNNPAPPQSAAELRRLERELDDIASEVEQRLPRAADGQPVKSLQQIGNEVLAAEAAQRQPVALRQPAAQPGGGGGGGGAGVAAAAGGPLLLAGNMPWARAAEALAAEAALLESSTGATWLLPGASQEEVGFLLLFLSLLFLQYHAAIFFLFIFLFPLLSQGRQWQICAIDDSR